MAFPAPPKPKGQVRRAGQRVSEGGDDPADILLIDTWRAAHGHALNTFQAGLRRRVEAFGGDVEFVQRLKRRNTVINKLRRRRPDGKPLVNDVTAMHDFAGCRLIFNSIPELEAFREGMHRGFSEHPLSNDADKYNYIASPKFSGYRGIHDVYKHQPRPHRRGDLKSLPWHGLKVEIQYRTKAQNSWATAVEMADLIEQQQTKFQLDGGGKRGRFFQLASEVIARQAENCQNALGDMSLKEIRDELTGLEVELGILSRLAALRAYDGSGDLSKHNVLNILRDDQEENGYRLEIRTFRNAHLAMAAANSAESDPASLNAVYVRADKPNQLRAAYKNYFSDPTNFVELLDL